MTLRAEVVLGRCAFPAGADFWLVVWAAFAGVLSVPARVWVGAAGDVRLRVVVPVAFRTGAFVAGADF